jgi:hypothetical protein
MLNGIPARFTQAWIGRTMPRLNAEQAGRVIAAMRERGWSDYEPPPNPMPDDDARRLVRNVVRKWLDWKLAEEA